MIEEGHVLDVASSQRLDKAVGFYEKSARKGNTDAMTDLGFLHEKGILGNDPSHLQSAIDYYKMAIEGHNPRAMNNLAGLFLGGRVIRPHRGELSRPGRARSLQVIRAGQRTG